MYRFIHIMILFCSVVLPTLCTEADDNKEKTTPFRIVGYLPEYRMRTIHNSWGSSLTDIIYFSIEPEATGQLDTSRFNKKALEQLQSLAKSRNIRLLICLGGDKRSKGFAPMATDKKRRQIFIANLTEFCRKHGFAGADFDWEFPRNKQQKEAYSILLAETKKAFLPHGLIVTVAVGSRKRLTADAYKAVDYVHLMSYDHRVKHAIYEDSVADVERQMAFGVPKEKLCLGVPFYGRSIKNRNARAYSDIVTTYHPTTGVDEVGGIYFNGINTIQKKARYAIEHGLGGIMIWEIGQDTFDDTSLLGAVKRTVFDADAQQRSKNHSEQESLPDKK